MMLISMCAFCFCAYAEPNPTDIVTITFSYSDTYQNIKFSALQNGWQETLIDDDGEIIPNPISAIDYELEGGRIVVENRLTHAISEYIHTQAMNQMIAAKAQAEAEVKARLNVTYEVVDSE